jgi:hypothetical protein
MSCCVNDGTGQEAITHFPNEMGSVLFTHIVVVRVKLAVASAHQRKQGEGQPDVRAASKN